MFCVFCLTNTGFVQCYSLGSHKVCCTLVFNFALFSNFCFACFASQTSGLCSAFPSAPVKSVTRFCCALVRTLFCVLCLTNTGLVRCYSLGSRKVCSMLVFILVYSVVFCFARFASQTPGLCSATPSAPVKFVACLCLFCFIQYTNFLLCVFCLTNIGFVQCFSLRPPCVYTLLVSLFYWVCFCYACFAQQAPVCAVIFPRLPSNLHA